MKEKVFILLVMLILNSCSDDKENRELQNLSFNEFPQEWELVKITGSIPGYEITNDEIEMQEIYVFESDGSFSKTRIENQKETSFGGHYILSEDKKSIQLMYDESNPIIGNCSSDENIENLYIDEEDQFLLNNWWACDGPGLYYQRVK
ncbi:MULTISPECIES: hypothetical protein [Zunongwangia]|uniref:Lipocalin-like domain-containing protein n=1 Tax=Zunongwangia atlantica 22II14-10F7 TaxID=1185767 RepID=A0A1Y1T7E4_9FLAO|nr:hypothetical protein [Zunongwangia atlantica]ORL46343.1 hypothetical protein IIF7_07226 [Zunongwangia atlantica 22II14-10F7]|tara:strand:- start:9 stop:452 length:444 start_codon:yes stop_codon:yes gene_type:complete